MLDPGRQVSLQAGDVIQCNHRYFWKEDTRTNQDIYFEVGMELQVVSCSSKAVFATRDQEHLIYIIPDEFRYWTKFDE